MIIRGKMEGRAYVEGKEGERMQREPNTKKDKENSLWETIDLEEEKKGLPEEALDVKMEEGMLAKVHTACRGGTNGVGSDGFGRYLSDSQLRNILTQARKKSLRDYCLFYLSYKHGLRQAEVTLLTWDMVNLKEYRIWIPRVKNGISGFHPLTKHEKDCLERYYRLLRNKGKLTRYLFPLTCRAVRKICERYNFHHHQLRHTCGFHMALANIDVLKIKSWLGHKNIQNTLIYVAHAGTEFNNIPKWEIF